MVSIVTFWACDLDFTGCLCLIPVATLMHLRTFLLAGWSTLLVQCCEVTTDFSSQLAVAFSTPPLQVNTAKTCGTSSTHPQGKLRCTLLSVRMQLHVRSTDAQIDLASSYYNRIDCDVCNGNRTSSTSCSLRLQSKLSCVRRVVSKAHFAFVQQFGPS